MIKIYRSKTFGLLIGTGAAISVLLGIAVFRVVMAGCPEGWAEGGIACLLVPTDADLGTHLLSYAFIGIVVLGLSSGFILWQRQWARIKFLTGNLEVLKAPVEKLDSLVKHLGLNQKVVVINSSLLLCFCAGFFSPRIYISRGMIANLTREELEALLLHEKHHLSTYLPLKILTGKCITAFLFFIPLLRDLLHHYLIQSEIAADQSAIWQQGHRRGIAGALEKLIQQYSVNSMSDSAIAGAANGLLFRIDHLTGRTRGYSFYIPVYRIVTSLVVTALILAAILVPLPDSHPIIGGVTGVVSTYLGQGSGF